MATAASGTPGPTGPQGSIFPFHRANIHERRLAATVVRCAPLAFIVVPFFLVVYGAFRCTTLFLAITASLNVALWIFLVSSSLFAIFGMDDTRALIAQTAALEKARLAAKPGTWGNGCTVEEQDGINHVIVIANYKEDEAMLAETIQALSEAPAAGRFFVVLAMEAREVGAEAKFSRLQSRFSGSFSKIFATFHPENISALHHDGISYEEVPGKASNVKWAVGKVYETCLQEPGLSLDNIVLTVADADCIFHPYYFDCVSRDFATMRLAPGDQQKWTLWQAPQLPYRNYYSSPAPSRVWGYISSMYEVGGVSSLVSGGHHMLFSAYSLSLQLGINAEMWDGDVIAEDHHAYLKCFYYSVKMSVEEALLAESENRPHSGCQPRLRVRSVMLPVKSTSVVSAEGYWQTYTERWHQATRHCQGVAEMSYSFLCSLDLLSTVPMRMYNANFVLQLVKVNWKIVCMHIVPNVQALCLAVLTVFWLLEGWRLPVCPDRIQFTTPDNRTLLCGLAGAWVLTWPVVIPFILVAVANAMLIIEVFLKPSRHKAGEGMTSIWHSADGGVVPLFFSSTSLTTILLIIGDSVVFLAPLMAVYGFIAELIGCWNVMLRGNRFKYITAAKLIERSTNYGSTESSQADAKEKQDSDGQEGKGALIQK